jgi:hypothetical protein
MQIFKECTPEIAYWCTEVLSIFPTFDVDIHQSIDPKPDCLPRQIQRDKNLNK